MAFFLTETVSPTTSAGGAATVYTVADYNGFLQTIVYTIDGTNPYANGVVITVTAELSGLNLWTQTLATNASQTNFPSTGMTTQAGAAVGSTTVTKIPLVNERIKIVIASGGNTKVGAFQFIVGS